MLLGIHNALFLSWRWVWILGWGKWSTRGCRIPPLTYLRMHSCRSTPSCTETPIHDSSTPLSTDHWCRGSHAPRLSHRPPTPSSFFLSLSPPNFSPFASIAQLLEEKVLFFLCGHDWITLFFIFLLTPFSSFIFEGITHCFSVSPEPPQTGTGRHRFENAFFISPPHRHSKRMWQPQYQLLIFTAIFFHTNMLCYFYLLTSLVEESWEGLCNNIHWSGLTNLLLPPDPWPVHCLFARIGSLRGRELIGCIVKRGTALFQGVKQIGTQNIYTLFRI